MAENLYQNNSQGKDKIKHVDENNNEIGAVTRGEARAKKLYHRASYVFIRSKDNGKFVI